MRERVYFRSIGGTIHWELNKRTAWVILGHPKFSVLRQDNLYTHTDPPFDLSAP